MPLTVLASTNNPELLPQRHLRPNRIDTLIGFSYPVAPELLSNVLSVHWNRRGLDQKLAGVTSLDDMPSEILDSIKNFTPSHIAALCLAIEEELEFEDVEKLGEDGIHAIIVQEIEKALVPVSDMQDREKEMKKWRSSLTAKSSGIGFLGNESAK